MIDIAYLLKMLRKAMYDHPSSTYTRSGSNIIIEGLHARSADLPRAEKWAEDNGIDMLTYEGYDDVTLFFENDHDTTLAMLALI